MNSIQFFIAALLAIAPDRKWCRTAIGYAWLQLGLHNERGTVKDETDIHLNQALHLSNLSVPRIIDATQKAKLFCSYEMGSRTLNSVKWYKDGQEFFRYSPLTPPTTNWFPMKGVTIADGSLHCNQFICNVELEKLNVHSSGSYRCEVSGDAPEFKLIDKTANMTVGVLPKFDPLISGVDPYYKYGEWLLANCSSEWSNPAATLTWYINNRTAQSHMLQPQINEITRHEDGFMLYSSILQLRIHIDDSRFIARSEVLQLKCVADIMGIASVRRETKVPATILALKDAGQKQRLLGQGGQHGEQSSRSGGSLKAILTLAWLLGIANLLHGVVRSTDWTWHSCCS